MPKMSCVLGHVSATTVNSCVCVSVCLCRVRRDGASCCAARETEPKHHPLHATRMKINGFLDSYATQDDLRGAF